LLQPEAKINKNTIFVDNQEQLNNFKVEEFFNTTKELAENQLLDIAPQALIKPLPLDL
jgi:hypothetical protein